MTYDARRRDRYRLVVTTVTGLATCAVAGATGALTGMAEAQTARDAAEKASAPTDASGTARERRPRVVVKERPVRTRVVTRVVRVTVGGAQVSAPTSTSTSTSTDSGSSDNSGNSGNSGDSGSSGPGPAPEAPPPAPPPSQSSGS